MLREVVRAVACVIFSSLCVLLVPSSAWSASTDTGGSEPSASSSPATESATPSPEVNSTPPSPSEPSPSPSSSSSASVDSSPAPEPTEPAPTVTVTAEPEPAPDPEPSLVGTQDDPLIVRLDTDTTALLLLTSSLFALTAGVRVVSGFGSR